MYSHTTLKIFIGLFIICMIVETLQKTMTAMHVMQTGNEKKINEHRHSLYFTQY